MSIFENGWKGNILGGLAIGIGGAILAPIVLPVLASVAKPLVKATIKGGILVYEKGKESLSEVTEVFEDLVAEVKSEMAHSHASENIGEGGHAGETA
ncbi:MAG: DUF5132 domain-containing protein [Proteobacteria bacterium]|nr:DUF5132 domain-containing protein [Pseudomonadota bacterium]